MSSRAVRRVVVAIDASEPSVAAAEAAAEIAAALAVELAGLFVEDDRLLSLAGHPGASAIDAISAERRALERRPLERAMRAQAERARQRFAAAARRVGSSWRFEVRRGSVDEQILAGLEAGDLLAVGRVGWRGGRTLGGTARAALAQGPGAVLLLPRSPAPLGAVAVLFDASAGAFVALDFAARLATAVGCPLRLLVAREAVDLERVEQEAGEALGGREGVLELRRVPRGGLAEALALRDRRHRALLVAPADLPGVGASLEGLIEELDTPVLVVR